MKNQRNKQKGFTLIELIIVIVILGILAVTAAPRFIDLSTDAREKTLEGVKAALQGASQLVYAKAAIAGQQGAATATTALNSTVNVATVYGYPSAAAINSAADDAARLALVSSFLDLSSADFIVTSISATEFKILFSSDATTDTACYVSYTSAANENSPPLTTTVLGC